MTTEGVRSRCSIQSTAQVSERFSCEDNKKSREDMMFSGVAPAFFVQNLARTVKNDGPELSNLEGIATFFCHSNNNNVSNSTHLFWGVKRHEASSKKAPLQIWFWLYIRSVLLYASYAQTFRCMILIDILHAPHFLRVPSFHLLTSTSYGKFRRGSISHDDTSDH